MAKIKFMVDVFKWDSEAQDYFQHPIKSFIRESDARAEYKKIKLSKDIPQKELWKITEEDNERLAYDMTEDRR